MVKHGGGILLDCGHVLLLEGQSDLPQLVNSSLAKNPIGESEVMLYGQLYSSTTVSFSKRMILSTG